MKIIEEEGCRVIISYLSDAEIFALLDTVTKKQIKASGKEEAIDAIISYADSAEEFLQRQKIKREILLKYLHTEKVFVSPNSNKKSLIGTVLKTWGNKDSRFMDMELDDEEEENKEEPEVEVPAKKAKNTRKGKKSKSSKTEDPEPLQEPPVSDEPAKDAEVVTQQPVPTNQIEQKDIPAGPNVPSVSSLPPQINVHVHLNHFTNMPTPMGPGDGQGARPHAGPGAGMQMGTGDMPLQSQYGVNTHTDLPVGNPDVQTLGEKFAKWFYDNLNSFNPTSSLNLGERDFGPQHFWDDVHLSIDVFTPSLHNETFDGPVMVSQRLLCFTKDDKVLFNANISREGVFVKSNPHGLVKIMACGSLHRGNACLGLFQQAFGIIRDPRFENNWKIKYTKLQMRTGEVTSLPKLEGDLEGQVNALVPI